MLAILDVEAIKLSTKLGNVKLAISATLRNDEIAKLAKLGLQYLVWHVVPAEAYSKESGFKREDAYSDKVVANLVASSNKVIGDYFSDIEIATEAYEKPDPIAKLVKQYVDLGFSEADAQAMAKQVQEKLAAQAKPVEKPAKTADLVEA